MNESEYIRATNRAKVSMAIKALSDVMPGDSYGISQQELGDITSRLCNAEEKLFSSYTCKEDFPEDYQP